MNLWESEYKFTFLMGYFFSWNESQEHMRAEVIHVWFCSKGTVEGTKARGISDMFCQELGIKRVLKHDAL